MAYTHQGLAHVILSHNDDGIGHGNALNEALTITLADTGTPGVMRLEFAQVPLGPADTARYVWLLLPSGRAVCGPILQDKRQPGGGWLTFKVVESDTRPR